MGLVFMKKSQSSLRHHCSVLWNIQKDLDDSRGNIARLCHILAYFVNLKHFRETKKIVLISGRGVNYTHASVFQREFNNIRPVTEDQDTVVISADSYDDMHWRAHNSRPLALTITPHLHVIVNIYEYNNNIQITIPYV